MSTERKLFGRATIHIDGQFYDSDPGASIVPGGLRATAREFTHGVKFSQRLTKAVITCAIPFTGDVSLVDLASIMEVPVSFKCDNGRSYIVRNAVQTGDAAVSGGDSGGTISLTLEGDPAEEVVDA